MLAWAAEKLGTRTASAQSLRGYYTQAWTMPPDQPSFTRRAKANERPLVEDIRLLGRILGDVIREQEGGEAFDLVERIRTLSVAFRRDADHEADKALKTLLQSLSGEQTVSVIRAFTYFSHLANLAEDRHHIRRRMIHERAGDTQEGSIEVALARLRWAGISPKTVSQTLAHSYLSPVLTAHPTEVQRKSILDAERAIANLLTARDEIKAGALPKDALAPRELAANETQIRARAGKLQTACLVERGECGVDAVCVVHIFRIHHLQRQMGRVVGQRREFQSFQCRGSRLRIQLEEAIALCFDRVERRDA